MNILSTIQVVLAGVPRPPRPTEPPPLVREGAERYYRQALEAWLTWVWEQRGGSKFGDRQLEELRCELVAWLKELVSLGFARQGMLDWPFIARFSCDFCIIDIDENGRPIRSLSHVGLDIDPLSERLAAYWLGAR